MSRGELSMEAVIIAAIALLDLVILTVLLFGRGEAAQKFDPKTDACTLDCLQYYLRFCNKNLDCYQTNVYYRDHCIPNYDVKNDQYICLSWVQK